MKNKQIQIIHKFGGAIPLLRKFREHPFWTEKRKFSRAEAWIDLLFMARYGTESEEIPDRGEIILIQYGQILTSIITLSKKWDRSRSWVNKLINILKKKQSILVITMNKRRTILQIVNMGEIKKFLQKNNQQIVQQTLHQKDNKKTYKNKGDKVDKEIIKEGDPVNKLLFLFEQVNPSYKLLFTNNTERNSLDRLIKQYGEEKLRNLIVSLPSIVQRPYAPRITTPYELEVKMAKLLLFLKHENDKELKGGVTQV